MPTFRVLLCLVFVVALGAVPLEAAVQGGGNEFRPYLHVLLAYGLGWLLIAAWIYRISQKLSELSRAVDAQTFEGE